MLQYLIYETQERIVTLTANFVIGLSCTEAGQMLQCGTIAPNSFSRGQGKQTNKASKSKTGSPARDNIQCQERQKQQGEWWQR